jgi:hypothetical protein
MGARRTFDKLVALTPAERRFLASAWLLAPAVELSLARFGLQRTLDGIERLTARGKTGGVGVSVARGEELVAAAYARHVVRGRCLPRALLQYALHRRLGDHVRLVIGVRPPGDDLDAHAWVEDPAGVHRSRQDGFEPLLERESRGVSTAA